MAIARRVRPDQGGLPVPTRRSTIMGVLGVLALVGTAAAQHDMTGRWTMTVYFREFADPRTITLDITQTGPALSTPDGHTGTIDLATGFFEISLAGTCPAGMSGYLMPTGDAQGSATATMPPFCQQEIDGFFIGVRTLCGNGVLDAGEQCESSSPCCIGCRHAAAGAACASDDNACTSDVCDATGTCTHPPLPADTSCPDDGQGCTADRCDGTGSCTHPVLPAGSTCSPGGAPCRTTCDGVDTACPLAPAGTYDPSCGRCEACDGSGACAPGRLTGCRQPTAPRASTVKLQRFADHTRDRFVWKWAQGQATTLADFGPVETDGLTICAWDAADEPVAAAALGAASGWKRTARRLVYRDKSGSHGPLSSVSVTVGAAGKSRIAVQGRGDLGMPLGPLTPPLVVQYANADGQCWQSTFGTPVRNDGTRFQARAD
jgi:hypothetical protein